MKLYHGTNQSFTKIEISKSQVGKDFGCGFYLSASKEQAQELGRFHLCKQKQSHKGEYSCI